jgi:D-methionine transport system ATP-binding protein
MEEIRIERLSKSFGSHKVLDEVSLSIDKGDIYGILGLSGAGKSTLLRSINGLERIDEGAVYYQGKLLAGPAHPIARCRRREIAMIFQSFNLLQQLSAEENVELALKLAQEDHRREKALAALKTVGILDKAASYPAELSGGEKQRVAIARAIALKPEVLLSDEATSSLDGENTEQVLALLGKLNKELGLTIVMVSHQISVIESVCNRVALLDQAKIIEEGELSEVFLAPKTALAKELIYATHVKTMLDEKRMLRLLFNGNLDEPIIAEIVEDCSLLVSIVYADSQVIAGKMYGQVVIKLPKEEKDSAKLKRYLAIKGVAYEEVSPS